MARAGYITAEQASRALKVSRATLYAYVSRGLIHSVPDDEKRRSRLYRRDDIELLASRGSLRLQPTVSADGALQWGMPVLSSKITLIESGQLYYRGLNATELSRTWHFEEVAAWLALGAKAGELEEGATQVSFQAESVLSALDSFPPITKLAALIAVLAANDPRALDTRPLAAAQAGLRLLRQLTTAITGQAHGSIAERLAAGWNLPNAAMDIESALILCADHELNVSAFAARCVASARSGVHQAISAGLAALQGPRHGGATERVAALFREAQALGNGREAVNSRLRRGEDLPGFGHLLYPSGDPRGRELLRRADAVHQDPQATELISAVFEATGERPTIDFALVALANAWGFPSSAPLTIFALGRAAGWIAHAVEQYESGILIRPRARYEGEHPKTTLTS